MKLWLLEPAGHLWAQTAAHEKAWLKNDRVGDPYDRANPWDPGYDKALGFVVRAATEDEARSLASERSGDEGAAAWMNPRLSTCTPLMPDGDAGIVLADAPR